MKRVKICQTDCEKVYENKTCPKKKNKKKKENMDVNHRKISLEIKKKG